MEFIPGSHKWRQLRYGPETVPGSINAGAQSINVPIDTRVTGLAPLKTGQMSLHHTLLLHDSAPNRGSTGGGAGSVATGEVWLAQGTDHGGSLRGPGSHGDFSCTAHIDGKLPAITWRRIPFRHEGERITGLYTLIDYVNHRNSVVFSGTLSGQSARVNVTAGHTDGSPSLMAEMTGSRPDPAPSR